MTLRETCRRRGSRVESLDLKWNFDASKSLHVSRGHMSTFAYAVVHTTRSRHERGIFVDTL